MASHNQSSEFAWSEASQRFQFAGVVTLALGMLFWASWFYPFNDLVDRSGTPLGGDYVMLYVAGQTVAAGEATTLYDDALNQRRTARLFPSMDPEESWPYRYPPTVAACMLPLASLPFTQSFIAFVAIQLGLLLAILWIMYRNFSCLREQPRWLWAIAGCPLILEIIVGGQSSLLAMICTVGGMVLLRNKQEIAAGAVLALALYKPNVLSLLILGVVIVHPRVLLGMLPTAMVGVLVAIASVGPSVLLEYLSLGAHLASSAWELETPIWKVHGLAPYFQTVLPTHGKLVCFLVGASFSVGVAVTRRSSRCGWYSAIAGWVCINALFNPYVPSYDLILLVAAFMFASEAAYENEFQAWSPLAFQCVAMSLFVGPHISQAIAQSIGIQIFPLVVVATAACTLWNIKSELRSSQPQLEPMPLTRSVDTANRSTCVPK